MMLSIYRTIKNLNILVRL